MKRYVIIGGSIAGVSCVEGIRSADAEGEITLVCAEKAANYGRPLISYYLEGKTDFAHMSWRGADFFEKNRVRALLDTRAEKLDAQNRQLVLSDGETLDYDALCICAGSYPFSPRFEGIERWRGGIPSSRWTTRWRWSRPSRRRRRCSSWGRASSG